MKMNLFKKADILLPQNIDNRLFSVVACDQYTSEPDYWNEVKETVSDKPSSLHLIFPEIYLKSADFDKTIQKINSTMQEYLEKNIFTEYKESFIYLERKQKNGKIRKGLIGMIDLEGYDYQKGSTPAIRATEGTVLERIPPRVKIRENAPLELPHVMLLIDDEQKSVIEPIAKVKESLKKVYSFELMQSSGSMEGYLLSEDESNRILQKIDEFSNKDSFNQKYNVFDQEVLLFAVGDGNHSLATAKKCYQNLKETLGEEQAMNHPARYALVELVNLHDDSLEFEAIHRIMTHVNPDDVLLKLNEKFMLSNTPSENSQQLDIVTNGQAKRVYILNPTLNLAVGSLQEFIDEYLKNNDGEVDYIHGEDVVYSLSKEKDSIGFILPSMDKNDLFKTVILDGALPRKTFSMGEACDKRFYLESRKIK